jgi:hypothetical protein
MPRRLEHCTLREPADIGSGLSGPSLSDGEWVNDTMEDVDMDTKSSDKPGLRALTEGGAVCAGTEEELLEVGKVSQTKGQIFGNNIDTSASDFRLCC